MIRIRKLWSQFVRWRNTPTNTRAPLPEAPVPKIDASDSNIATGATGGVGSP